MKKYCKEPLIQFLMVALVLHFIVSMSKASDNTTGDIVVDNQKLIIYLQYQLKAFNTIAAQQYFLSMNKKEKSQLMADYIRDEVLYREALSLGLDKNDEIIRRRLIQKMDYISQGVDTDIATVTEQELTEYFETHLDEFTIPASATFTHIFFDTSKREESAAMASAARLLIQLNREQVPFESAARFGDRFVFHRNYVERTQTFVKSHFGVEMSERIFTQTKNKYWYGPLTSPYGIHLVFNNQLNPERVPILKEVAPSVLADVRRLKSDAAKKSAIDEVISRYTINVSPVSELNHVL